MRAPVFVRTQNVIAPPAPPPPGGIIVCLAFEDSSRLLSRVAVSVYIPSSDGRASPQPPQHVLGPFITLTATLMHVRWHLAVAFICISLTTND